MKGEKFLRRATCFILEARSRGHRRYDRCHKNAKMCASTVGEGQGAAPPGVLPLSARAFSRDAGDL